MGIPLAALSIQQQPNILDQYGKAVNVVSALQNQKYQAQAQPLEIQQRQQAVQEQQEAIATRQATRQAYAAAVQPDEKGQPQIDPGILTKALANSGHGDVIPAVLDSVNKFQKSKNDLIEQGQKIQEATADANGHAAAAIKAANYDPNVAHTIVDTLPNTPQTQQLRQMIDGDPAVFKQHIDSAIASSPAQQKMQNEQDVARIRAQGSAELPLGDKVPQLNQALAGRYQVLNPGKPLPPELSLQPNATQKDFDRVDKIMQQTEQAQGTKAQQDTVNAIRKETKSAADEVKNTARSDKSYQFNSTQLESVAKPIDQIADRMGRLQSTLAQNTPQADALVAPELLSVMAGGSGSGLRMNEAEIARIVGGRSKWEDLKASINKWSLDPKEALSITPEQRQEIRALTQTVQGKVTAKQQAITDARNGLLGTHDPDQYRKIVADAREKMSSIDSGNTAPQHQVGDTVSYKGQPHVIQAINPDGSLVLK